MTKQQCCWLGTRSVNEVLSHQFKQVDFCGPASPAVNTENWTS